MVKKKCLQNSVITFVVCLLFFNIYFYIKYGANYLNVEDLKYGIPLWTFLLTYVAFGTTKYYYSKKEIFIPEGIHEEEKAYRLKSWLKYKQYMISKLFRILGGMFGMASPLYLLAYIEESDKLKSSPFLIVTFVVLTIFFLLTSEIMRKKYLKEIHKK
ncbi:MAG: hypothetical protein LUE98_00700 [Tannerellaceae bacterium]|nr:hypothetical protein [Tannerellaceae bacterium]